MKKKLYEFRNPKHKINGFVNQFNINYDDVEFGCKVDVEDGIYKVNTTSTSFKRIEEIPKQKNVISFRDDRYPQFTQQNLSGELTVKNKTIDLKELDELIPNDWGEYNSHCFLEDIGVIEDSWCLKKTKYLTLFFGS